MRLSKSHWAGGRQVTRARLLPRYRVRSLFNHARYNLLDNLTGVTQNAQSSTTTQARIFAYDWLGRMTSEQNPETAGASYSYVYDADGVCGTSNGDLVKRLDALSPTPNTTCYAYDVLHRVKAVTYPASGPYASRTPPKTFVYDVSSATNTMGRLAEAYTGPSSPKTTDLTFTYSARGEVTDVYELTPHSNGAYYHVTASYWANGLVNTLNPRLTGLPTWTYNPDGEGRVSTVSASVQNPVTNTSYNVAGQPTAVTFGSADSDAFQFDANTGRMTQYQATVGTQLVTGALTWNANGSLRQLAISDLHNSANAQTCTYVHDDLARLGQVDCGANKFGQTYSYQNDNFGNITWTQMPGHTGSTFTPTGGYSTSTNRFVSLGSYDANGNLTSDGAHTYAWDADGHLYQLVDTLTTMTYDALGRRAETAKGLIYNEILYGPGGSKLALIDGLTQSVNAAFLPLPGGATAVYDATGLKRYRHSDWLGSSRVSSTTNQAFSYDGAYSPIGESYAEMGSTDRSFTGQNQDLYADLYAFPFREYHPIHGRWLSPDPAGVAAVNPANPQSWNRYAYVNGSPLNSVDPLGLATIDCPPGATGRACETPVKESVLHFIDPAGIYSSPLFMATTLGVQTVTLWDPRQSTTQKVEGTSNFCGNCRADFYIEGTSASKPDDGQPDQMSAYGQSFVLAMGERSGALNSVVNGLAIATGVLVVAPVAVDAALASSIEVAVGPGQGYGVHFAYEANGMWLHWAETIPGQFEVTSENAAAWVARSSWFTVPVPVLNHAAVVATAGATAANCFTAVCGAVAAGWGF